MHWVEEVVANETAVQYIRQIFDPIFQVTGGYMTQAEQNLTLLIFGQNFAGFYVPSSNGVYTEQVRRFRIEDDGMTLSFSPQAPAPPDPNDRRRDLNIVPVVTATLGVLVSSWVALSGVFTLPGGAWTVPVSISPLGVPSMADPSLPGTFKQGMNNYVARDRRPLLDDREHVHRRDGRHQLRILRQRRLSDRSRSCRSSTR